MTKLVERFDKVFCRSISNTNGSSKRHRPNVTLYLLPLLTLCTSVNATTTDGICGSQIVQNDRRELLRLRNCRVIEGYLQISNLYHPDDDTSYEDFSLPELVEITDFLLLFRVEGFPSLAHLFPNLQVIRGNNLFTNYALIIYSMPDLTEIGLTSLTTIVRGAVRIEKNPLLCFVDTINWVYIANGTIAEDHFIDSNKNSNECAVCPTGKKGDGDKSDTNGSDVECPVSKQDPKKRYCWNRHICQKICPDHCGQRSCDDNGTCCDETCLGSCDSKNTTICTACRKLSVGPLDNRSCVETCPGDLFIYEQRRCITRDECWNISKPFATAGGLTLRNPFIPFDGICTWTCPKYHTAEGPNGQRYCKSCNGECKKECHGSTIDSISGAQNYRGCAIITGTLIIQIRQGGQNVIKELEQSLSDIEEIEGALKVIRSYPLISLNFFKKLKVIHGKKIQENFALYVMDNQNLQSLFEHDVIIEEGKIFFHFNSKLCYSTIEAIKKNVYDLRGVEKLAIEDVAINSNGDKVACNLAKLIARPSSVMHIGAVIDVEAMNYDDERVLLGYVLHFKQAPYQNVSLYDSRDACGGDGWRVEDTTTFDRKAPMVQIILTNLKPYTQYAYYVKTYTIASEPNGGQSDILYFRTKPWQPGTVQKMKLLPNGSSSIIVTWEPPKVANGELTIYIVKAAVIYDDPELLQQRNYCEEPIRIVKDPPCEQSNEENPVAGEQDDISDFPLDDWNFRTNVAEDIINFENELQNFIYVKQTMSPYENRKRRNVARSDAIKEQILGVVMVNQTNASTYTFTLDKLRHFTMYSISVQACRDVIDPVFSDTEYCSNAVVLRRRTSKIGAADNVTFVNYRKVKSANNEATDVHLLWQEPKEPNGLILSYTVVYKRVDLANVRSLELCFTQKDYRSANGEIKLPHLANGNYSISVKATSLAGDGYLSLPLYLSAGNHFNIKQVLHIQMIVVSFIICFCFHC